MAWAKLMYIVEKTVHFQAENFEALLLSSREAGPDPHQLQRQ